jgi:hypothetical protein
MEYALPKGVTVRPLLAGVYGRKVSRSFDLSISPALKPDRLLIGRARMEASEFQNASLQCDRDRVGAIAGVELRQDAVDARFDGALGEFVTQSSSSLNKFDSDDPSKPDANGC